MPQYLPQQISRLYTDNNGRLWISNAQIALLSVGLLHTGGQSRMGIRRTPVECLKSLRSLINLLTLFVMPQHLP